MKNLNTFKLLSDYESEKSGVLNTPNVSFVEEDNSVRYLLEYPPTTGTENGYEWVDLGLPSGLKWATCNVGAVNPQDYGLYFAWGETTGYTADQITVGERAFDKDTYNAGPAASISADLTLEQDAARANLGGRWRMPTKAELEELIANCTGAWTNNYNGMGIGGRIFTGPNGNSVFFPASGNCNEYRVIGVGSYGYIWSASWYSSSNAWYLYLLYSGKKYVYNMFRIYGLPVRGVCE